MSDTLFSLTGEYRELFALLTDDPDSEIVQDSLDSVMGAIEKKGEGYVAIINQLEMEADACDKQIEFWKNKKQVRENARKNLEIRLVNAMCSMGLNEIQAGKTTISIRNNGGKLPLIIKGDVPAKFMKTKIIEEKDTDKIRKALDAGEKLDFAEYGERGKGIRFK